MFRDFCWCTVNVTYYVWADAIRSGEPFFWCSVAGYLSCRCRLYGSSKGLTCVWMGEFILRRGDAESYFSAHSGGIWYKTKGTVLVFSWCGSGFIMPQIEKERQKERKAAAAQQASHRNELRSVVTVTKVKRSTATSNFRNNRDWEITAAFFPFLSICIYLKLPDVAPPICLLARVKQVIIHTHLEEIRTQTADLANITAYSA